MKLIAVAIIACILFIGFTEGAAGTTDCGCQVCGPAGKACQGCPERIPLCQDLINTIQTLQKKVRQCVCGIPTWML
ncbi:salivary glue protein Sgs-7-like [Drosophila subpulchrella]|uniref:salivary glue protein Sgs-7-like n=1 Tax=Drosophila subpulchrella TaxID=1486046 RepID=UPI0018A170E6|nr:salivary glue protein Sgs-7-like [Drosophila subpulchrella]